jgi:hypothetical protein
VKSAAGRLALLNSVGWLAAMLSFRTRTTWSAACAIVLTLGTAAIAAPPQVRPADPPNELHVRAGFLLNFARFVEWPGEAFDDASAPVVIGVVGSDPFGDTLDELTRGEKVNGRAVAVRRYAPGDLLLGCHVLYIGVSSRTEAAGVVDRLGGSSVLTVSDADDFLRAGGIIRFVKVDGRIGFEIDLQAAGRANLKISARLLSLATVVQGREPPGRRR